MRRTPALIVGGGPAGTAAAITLAKARLPHLLIERTRETGDALCGGFLSWRTLETLATLGVAAETLNPHRIAQVRIVAGEHVVEAALPQTGLAVSRQRLDSVLLTVAAGQGAAIERGVAVREVDAGCIRTGDGATIESPALFLASGKHDVRGLARPESARGRDPTLGLRVRIRPTQALARALAGNIELHLFDRGYAGLALQEDGSANLCMAVHRSRLQAAGSPAALLAELGRHHARLGDWIALVDAAATIDAVANVPYGWRQQDGEAGLFRLGDQAGVIPSLAGEGMGIALASGLSAARAHRNGLDGVDWQRRFARAIARPIAVADVVRRVAEGRQTARLLPFAHPLMIRMLAHATRIGQS